jgi:hypothetical protein
MKTFIVLDPTITLGNILATTVFTFVLIINHKSVVKAMAKLEAKVDFIIDKFN